MSSTLNARRDVRRRGGGTADLCTSVVGPTSGTELVADQTWVAGTTRKPNARTDPYSTARSTSNWTRSQLLPKARMSPVTRRPHRLDGRDARDPRERPPAASWTPTWSTRPGNRQSGLRLDGSGVRGRTSGPLQSPRTAPRRNRVREDSSGERIAPQVPAQRSPCELTAL